MNAAHTKKKNLSFFKMDPQPVIVQKHLFNTKFFTNIIPEYFRFYSACYRMSNGQLTPDPSNYSAFALWLYIFLSLLSFALYSYPLTKPPPRKKALHYLTTIGSIILNLYLTNYVLHGIVNCSGWTAFGRAIVASFFLLIVWVMIGFLSKGRDVQPSEVEQINCPVKEWKGGASKQDCLDECKRCGYGSSACLGCNQKRSYKEAILSDRAIQKEREKTA